MRGPVLVCQQKDCRVSCSHKRTFLFWLQGPTFSGYCQETLGIKAKMLQQLFEELLDGGAPRERSVNRRSRELEDQQPPRRPAVNYSVFHLVCRIQFPRARRLADQLTHRTASWICGVMVHLDASSSFTALITHTHTPLKHSCCSAAALVFQ